MDAHDPLDAILDDSAPTTLRIDPEVTRDLELMSRMAALEVAAESRRRRVPRLAIGLGLVALLTAGGGAAVAAGGLGWLPWAENPDLAYSFTLPSGRACEERIVLTQHEQAGDFAAFVADVRALTVDDVDVQRIAEQLRTNPQAVVQVVDDDGKLSGPGVYASKASEDDLYAVAHHVALGDAISALPSAAGTAGVNVWWDGEEQLLCEVVTP